MRRSMFCAASALLLGATALLAVGGPSRAQDADLDAAIGAFDAAISALDWAKMEPLWARDSYVSLILPESRAVAVGPEAVKQTFGGEFGALAELKVTAAGAPAVHIKGDTAWVTRLTTGKGKTKSGFAFDEPTFDAAIYERRDGKWLLVAKTALRMAVTK